METTLICFRIADSTKLENKGLYKPMLYQFCIAKNAIETRFWPLSDLKLWITKDAFNLRTPFAVLNFITYQTIILADIL